MGTDGNAEESRLRLLARVFQACSALLTATWQGRLATGIGDRVVELSFERGVLTLECGHSSIRLSPALGIKTSEIDDGLQILEQSITLAEKEVLTSAWVDLGRPLAH